MTFQPPRLVVTTTDDGPRPPKARPKPPSTWFDQPPQTDYQKVLKEREQANPTGQQRTG